MIKISLEENYLKDEEINKIFEKHSERILTGIKKKSIKYYYNSKTHEMKTSDDIKKFLLAKDFYNYSFDCVKYKKLFEYSHLLDKDRHTILTKMNISVCPYCNMNYTLNYNNNKKNKRLATADLDHFYLKSNHPMYALCLFNFIPSCSICNSRLKHTKETSIETHVFPHECSFEGNAEFRISNIDEILLNDLKIDSNIMLKYLNDDVKYKNSNELFQIESRYNELKIIANELLEKTQVYNTSYRDELSSILGEKEIKYNLKELIFGRKLTEEEMLNFSLGKFKNDLLKQLCIFE